jgi:WD40 repeat protein
MSVSGDGLAVMSTVNGVSLARNGAILTSTPLAGATAVAVTRDGRDVAVGCASGSVHLFAVTAAGELQPRSVLAKHRDAITALEFDAAGTRLASSDANREIIVWDRTPEEPHWLVKSSLGRCVFHQARITCMAWAPDGTRLATSGLDTNIIVWDMALPASKRVTISGAHREGVTALQWANAKLLSAGADACLRVWA